MNDKKNSYRFFPLRLRSLRNAVFAALIGSLLFFALGWYLGRESGRSARPDGASGVEMRSGGYALINPPLECETAREESFFKELEPFKKNLEELVKEKTDAYQLSHVSLYFRDLNDGSWFGINEDEEFAPASLLKVPTMIACLKEAEERPGFLSKRIRFSGSRNYDEEQNIKPSHMIESGRSYAIDDLLNYSIAYSDNNANVLLFNSVNRKLLARTYRTLGV